MGLMLNRMVPPSALAPSPVGGGGSQAVYRTSRPPSGPYWRMGRSDSPPAGPELTRMAPSAVLVIRVSMSVRMLPSGSQARTKLGIPLCGSKGADSRYSPSWVKNWMPRRERSKMASRPSARRAIDLGSVNSPGPSPCREIVRRCAPARSRTTTWPACSSRMKRSPASLKARSVTAPKTSHSSPSRAPTVQRGADSGTMVKSGLSIPVDPRAVAPPSPPPQAVHRPRATSEYAGNPAPRLALTAAFMNGRCWRRGDLILRYSFLVVMWTTPLRPASP